MANPADDTCEILKSLGGKEIFAPKSFGKKFQEKRAVLVAILHTEHGQYLKELGSEECLSQVK